MKSLIFLVTFFSGLNVFAQPQFEFTSTNSVLKGMPYSGIKTFVPPPTSYLQNPNIRTSFIYVNYDSEFKKRPQAMAAFDYAVSILSTIINSSVLIEVDAKFENLGTGFLGYARPTVRAADWPSPTNYDPNTLYPIALANKIAQSDLYPQGSDIECSFNSANPDFYYGTSGNTPANKFDFVTVVLHELMHGLGFSAGAKVDIATGIGKLINGTPAFYSIYDKFVQNTAAQSIKTFPEGTIQLGNQLTGNALTWNGNYAITQNPSGLNPKLFAPSPWQQGSSYAHWDENYYFQGNINSLMTPIINMGESIHNPGNVSIGLLKDIGWAVNFTTGIGDYITINPFNTQLTQGSGLNLRATFHDQNDPSYVVEYWCELEVFKSGGKYIHKFKAPSIPTYGYPFDGIYWYFSIGFLPNAETWVRDNNGDVLGKITVFTKDHLGYTNSKSVPITIKHVPDKPQIQLNSIGDKSLSFSYYSNGATNYTIYYDTNSGQPYTGNQAIQGTSGFTSAPGLNTITLSNLTNNINYYLSIKGTNTAGSSVYSNELVAKPTKTTEVPCACDNTNKSINDVFKIKNLIFPNPANRLIHFKSNDLSKIVIQDRIGKVINVIVLESGSSDEFYTLNCENLLNGIYIAVFFNLSGEIITQKFVVSHP